MTVRDGDFTLISWNPHTGKSTWIAEIDGKTVIREDMPIDAIIDANTQARNSAAPGWAGDWHRVASIPAPFYYGKQLDEASKQDDRRYIQKILNDADFRAWRTKDGTL